MTQPEGLHTTCRRGVIALGLLLLARPAMAAPAPCAAPRVLFVCPAGSVKSAIAREEMKRRAAARGLSVQISSRGIDPADHVSPLLAARLKADGIDTRAEPLRALTPSDIAQADILIAFDEATKAPGLEQARSWDVPSWSQYAEAKAALLPKIDGLLDELAGVARRGCSG
jgi:protein-tyrosine-phosphatase